MEYMMKTQREAETFHLVRKIGDALIPGQIIVFYGDLGAGKTVLTKGIAASLGIEDTITSPTFTILQEYHDGRMPLYHLDVYRITDPDEMEEVGLDDCLYGNGITVIEWAEMIEEILPENVLKITIDRVPEEGMDVRRILMEVPDETEFSI